MDITETAKAIYDNAVAKGFYDKPTSVGERLMLIVSELGEALEADRHSKYCGVSLNTEELLGNPDTGEFVNNFKLNVKDTFQDELADAFIRILDLAQWKNIDIAAHVAAKMRYNATRERMHGKAY